jgi:hypothetical protein
LRSFDLALALRIFLVAKRTEEPLGGINPDHAVQQRRDHRRIDAPGQPGQHRVRTNLFPQPRDAVGDDIAGTPQRIAGTGLAQEALENAATGARMRDLRPGNSRLRSFT